MKYKMKSTQAHYLTVLQKYCNEGSTYSLSTTIFVISIVFLRPDLNQFVIGVTYHCTMTVSMSVIGFTIYICFQNDSG